MKTHMVGPSTEESTKLAFGPDSLLWKHAADRRLFLLLPTTGLMLNMLPGVSAAIMEQSVFWDEPLQRTLRSVPPIVDSIYDREWAHTIRDYHRDLKGVDHHGNRFHALNPELYFASHAIFTYSFMSAVDRFVEPLDDDAKRRFYEDCKIWYLQYGVSAREMPETWEDFQAYWADLCRNGLEATPAARRLVNHVLAKPAATPPPHVPRLVWLAIRPFAGAGIRFITVGALPPEVRETLGLSWTSADRAQYAAMMTAARRVGPLLPPRIRDSARARRTRARAERVAG